MNMRELLNKRMADLTVIEVMEFSYLNMLASKPTIPLNDFCKVIGKDKSRVYKLIKNKLIPEEILVGGFENRTRHTPLLFHTEEVIKWLKK